MNLRARQSIVVGLLCVMIGLWTFVQIGCGGSARNATIRAQLELLNAARDKFVKFNRAAQLHIVSEAQRQNFTKDMVKAAIGVYRTAVQVPTVAALSAGYEQLIQVAMNEASPLSVAIEVVTRVATYIGQLKVGADPPATGPCAPPCSSF